MARWMNWSECVKLYEDLRNDQPGVIGRIRKVKTVDFRDFIRSFKSMDKSKLEKETQAVHEVLKRSPHLEVVLWNCNLGEDHIKLLLCVFADVKLTELHIAFNKNISPEGWSSLGRLVKQSELKKLSAVDCDMKDEGVEKLCQGMDGAKLTKLDIAFNKNISPEGWLSLGRLVKQSELKILAANECDMKDEGVKKLCQGMDGAKLTELNVDLNENISPEGWLSLGRLVKQSELKKLSAVNCDMKDEGVKKLCQGMDGAKIDHITLGNRWRKPFYRPSVLSLLLLVNEELHIYGWKINKTQRTKLQKRLNQCSTALTIVLSCGLRTEVLLKASPKNLPLTLPEVKNVNMKQDGNSILATWDPLPNYDNVSYYIVVGLEFKTVRDPVTTSDTEYRMSSIQAEADYYFFIWAFTRNSISKCVSWGECTTGRIPMIDEENPKLIVEESSTAVNSRKRSNQVLNADECKPKKAKLLQQWLESAPSTSNQNVTDHAAPGNQPSSTRPELQRRLVSSKPPSAVAADPTARMQEFVSTDVSAWNASNPGVMTQRSTSSDEAFSQNSYPTLNTPYFPSVRTPEMPDVLSTAVTMIGFPRNAGWSVEDTVAEDNMRAYSQPSFPNEEAWLSGMINTPPIAYALHQNTPSGATDQQFPMLNSSAFVAQDRTNGFSDPSSVAADVVYTPLRNVSSNVTTNNTESVSSGSIAAEPRAANLAADVTSTSTDYYPPQVFANAAPDVHSTSTDYATQIRSDPAVLENRMANLENLIASFQQEFANQQQVISKLRQDATLQEQKIANLEQCLEQMKRPIEAGDPDQIKDFIIPMKTAEDVKKNENLLESRENEKRLVSFLLTLGGSKKKNIIWRIMKQLFTNELALTYSWEGKKGKNAFCKLKMADVVKESCKKNKDSITEDKVEKVVMSWLKSAGDRDGGRKKREEQKWEKELRKADEQVSCST